MSRVSVIIPAYNEETTVGAVVEAARQVDWVAEVVVVSDGSVDATAEAARAKGARVVELEPNRGKAAAMKAGLLAARERVALFLDADLIGLRPEHIIAILEPVLSDRADVSVGVMRHGRAVTDLAQVVTPFLSGIRAGRVEMFEPLRDLDEAGWGAELALTLWAKERRMRVKEVPVNGVTQRMKEEKVGLARGLLSRLKMYWDIVRVVPRNERARR